MFLPNEPFKPPTSPPPPINWATKPGRATETVTTETVIQTTDGRRLVPIFIDLDHLSEFGQAVFRQIKQLEAETVSYDGSLSNPSNLSSTSGDISASLSQLSITETLSTTSLASVPLRLGATTPTMPISGSQSSPSKLTSGDSPQAIKKRKRYYVVTVGKCAGVFFDEWDKVKPLIEHVSGAQFQSYPTHTDAVAAYKRNKGMGLVRVVRDPGDDEIYGPMFYAVQ